MMERVNKVFIGKDINRTATGSDYESLLETIVEGEIIILDKNKTLIDGSAITYVEGSATDTIFVAQGTSEQVVFTGEDGTVFTTRKTLLSSPIEARLVVNYHGQDFVVKAEQATTLTFTGVPVLGTEYIIRIVYKDIKEHPGQFTQTYRHIATALDVASLDVFTDSLAAKVNAHTGRRVQATETSTTVVLTGKPIPECTTNISDIDEFDMVEFDVFMLRVNSDGDWVDAVDGTGLTALTNVNVAPVFGQGNWEQVRDAEKLALGYIGVSNKTHFPVLSPDANVIKGTGAATGGYYDTITIEHNKSYVAPNNQGMEVARLATIIYLQTALDGTNDGDQAGLELTTPEETGVVRALDGWMGSIPGNFQALYDNVLTDAD
ncbi:MAG: hypothetical protein ACTSQF_01870 [Candidatus Heimdallarchaeaceae archaeon]